MLPDPGQQRISSIEVSAKTEIIGIRAQGTEHQEVGYWQCKGEADRYECTCVDSILIRFHGWVRLEITGLHWRFDVPVPQHRGGQPAFPDPIAQAAGCTHILLGNFFASGLQGLDAQIK